MKALPHTRFVQSSLHAFFFLSLGLNGCGRSAQDTINKVRQLQNQSQQSISQHNFLDAEKQLQESLYAVQQLDSTADIVAETQSSLAQAQAQLGKFSLAIENYTAAHTRYKEIGNRNAEARTANALGETYFDLRLLNEAEPLFTNAQQIGLLFNEHIEGARAEYNLGKLYRAKHNANEAIQHFNTAIQSYESLRDTSRWIENLSQLFLLYAEQGDEENTRIAFEQAEQLAEHLHNTQSTATLHREYGAALSILQHWSAALQQYYLALAQLNTNQSPATQAELMKMHCAIGELFLRNHTFEIARQYFISSYNIAIAIDDKLATGYLLIRIADCELKNNIVAHTQTFDNTIQNYYEQALRLFAKNNFPFAEVIALHRLGIVKLLSSDRRNALTFFQRAFEIYTVRSQPNSAMSPLLWCNFDELTMAFQSPGTTQRWWYENFVSSLLHEERTNDAFDILQQAQTYTLSHAINSLHVVFRNPAASALLATIETQKTLLQIYKSELLFNTTLEAKNRDAEYQQTIQHKIQSANGALQTILTELQKQNTPLKNFMALWRHSVIAPISVHHNDLEKYLPPHTTAIEYFSVNNQLFAFVVRPDEPIRIVLLSKNYSAVQKKIETYKARYSGKISSLETIKIMRELYTLLLQPLESLLDQRLIIIPSEELTALPFHALLNATAHALIEQHDVSYLPALSLVQYIQPNASRNTAVVAFGISTNKQWSVEYELRDIRSSMKDAKIFLNQSATKQNLFESTGDVLQLSTEFYNSTPLSFALSNGTVSSLSERISISSLPQLHTYPVVYFSNQFHGDENLSPLYATVLLLNGSSNIIANLLPTTQKTNRLFSEKFYSSLAQTGVVNDAYRTALIESAKQGEQQWMSFFKFGK